MRNLLGEKNKVRSADYSIDTKHLGATRKTWSTTYYVLTDTTENEETVAVTPGLPILYEPYNNGFCIKKGVRDTGAVEGGYLWEVDCDFDSHIDADLPVVDYDWAVEDKDMVIRFDAITGIPILNSAREPIITTAPLSIPILNMSRIEADFTGARTLMFNNKLNLYTFLGAPPFCVRCVGPTARKKVLNGVRMWEVRYQFKFNMTFNPQTLQPMGWRMFLLDHGTRYIKVEDDGTESYTKFKTDEDKDDTTGNLDGSGGKLPEGAPEVYLGYNRFGLVNFNLLGLV